jgi:hypothetical protein
VKMHNHEKKPVESHTPIPETAPSSSGARSTAASAWERGLGTKPLIDLKLPIQTQLAVNQPGDAFEEEADQVAETVMRMTVPRAQRAATAAPLGGSATAANSSHVAPPIVHQTLQAPGQPLDRGARSFMESRFGADFGGVRVHTDPQAAASAKAVNAAAYTVGQNVVFGAGRFAPGTQEGQRLLAHELAHTIQPSSKGQTQPLKPRICKEILRWNRPLPPQPPLFLHPPTYKKRYGLIRWCLPMSPKSRLCAMSWELPKSLLL